MIYDAPKVRIHVELIELTLIKICAIPNICGLYFLPRTQIAQMKGMV